MLKKLIKLLKFLNSNSKASQIANSFCIGMILGLLPKNNLLWYVVLVFFMFVRIHKACYGIMILLGALIAPSLDPFFDKIGYMILTYGPLENTFADLLEIPFVGFTRFNNTIVMGSLVCGLLAYIPVFFLVEGLIMLWRRYVSPVFLKSKVMTAFYKVPLVQKIQELEK